MDLLYEYQKARWYEQLYTRFAMQGAMEHAQMVIHEATDAALKFGAGHPLPPAPAGVGESCWEFVVARLCDFFAGRLAECQEGELPWGD
jgi:hypothetical protein